MERLFGQSPASYTPVETKVTTITVYDAEPLGALRRRELLRGLRQIAESGQDVSPSTIHTGKVSRKDWSNSWKKYFRTIDIGGKLLIRPGWNKRRALRGQRIVVLNPGLSFGTGQHPTTAFCLRQLVSARRRAPPHSFLDIGTGSGILAIAAAKLGYAPVRAIDFDPVAVRIAKANARRNGVEQRVLTTCQDLTILPRESKTKYKLVAANLTDDLLLTESERILNRLHPEGRLVLAGILAGQFAAVQTAYEQRGLRLVTSRREDEWQSGVFARCSSEPPQ
jgi:ribosomal protein L11 methyltransferase